MMLITIDPDWTPSKSHPELFNEINFITDELITLTSKCQTVEDAMLLVNHPNSSQQVKAMLMPLLIGN